ncbi:uncharacterized protein LOC62_03G003553 [Vanrija pseudolonga]|uniref:Uncharacterized protein n=1 Tax=Vanrija pseudolonga TaxID=143232 RepID=A0AAF1BJM5_9TREE|nr:hypothetical protein LOC62_03G003553 [Vanrija pseudolonga]
MLHAENLYTIIHWLQRIEAGTANPEFRCNRCYRCDQDIVCYAYMPLEGYTFDYIVENLLDIGYAEDESDALGHLFTNILNWQDRFANEQDRHRRMDRLDMEPMELAIVTVVAFLLVLAFLAVFPAW